MHTATVNPQSRPLALLALGLFIATQHLSVYLLWAYRIAPPQVVQMAAMYSAGMLGCALCMPLLLAGAGGRRFLSPLPLLMALTVLLVLASRFAWQDSLPAVNARLICLGMCWPLALHAFFESMPPGSRGLALGLFFAAGELVWLVMLPIMGISQSVPPGQDMTGFMHKLLIAALCSTGLALAAFFTLNRNRGQSSPAALTTDAAPYCIPLLFAAAALFYIAFGLSTGLNLPKGNRAIVSENAHFALALAFPLAGALLDRGGRTLLAVLACLAFTAPIMLFTRDAVIRETMYITLYVGRWTLMLATLLLAERLAHNRKRLPLFFALAYALMLFASLPGSAIARALEDTAAKAGLSFGLALAFALLALRLRGALAGLPMSRDAGMPTPERGVPTGAAPARLAAFGKTHGLSAKEMRVMETLEQGRSSEEIAKALDVTESTVRTYVSRMLQKTDAPNRAALMALYENTKPAPAEPGDRGSDTPPLPRSTPSGS